MESKSIVELISFELSVVKVLLESSFDIDIILVETYGKIDVVFLHDHCFMNFVLFCVPMLSGYDC